MIRPDGLSFRDSILALCGRFPVMPGKLLELLRDEDPSVGNRRFYRALAWLVRHGKIQRVGTKQHWTDGGYVLVPNAPETADEIEARRRIALADDGRCVQCELRRDDEDDPPWFTRRPNCYCFSCYTLFARDRERLSAHRRRNRVETTQPQP